MTRDQARAAVQVMVDSKSLSSFIAAMIQMFPWWTLGVALTALLFPIGTIISAGIAIWAYRTFLEGIDQAIDQIWEQAGGYEFD